MDAATVDLHAGAFAWFAPMPMAEASTIGGDCHRIDVMIVVDLDASKPPWPRSITPNNWLMGTAMLVAAACLCRPQMLAADAILTAAAQGRHRLWPCVLVNFTLRCPCLDATLESVVVYRTFILRLMAMPASVLI